MALILEHPLEYTHTPKGLLAQQGTLASRISALVHMLQCERGASNLWLCSAGRLYAAECRAGSALVDEQLIAFREALEAVRECASGALCWRIASALWYLEQLLTLRDAVRGRAIIAEEATNQFSRIIRHLLNIVPQLNDLQRRRQEKCTGGWQYVVLVPGWRYQQKASYQAREEPQACVQWWMKRAIKLCGPAPSHPGGVLKSTMQRLEQGDVVTDTLFARQTCRYSCKKQNYFSRACFSGETFIPRATKPCSHSGAFSST